MIETSHTVLFINESKYVQSSVLELCGVIMMKIRLLSHSRNILFPVTSPLQNSTITGFHGQ